LNPLYFKSEEYWPVEVIQHNSNLLTKLKLMASGFGECKWWSVCENFDNKEIFDSDVRFALDDVFEFIANNCFCKHFR